MLRLKLCGQRRLYGTLCVSGAHNRVKESLCKLLTDSLWRNVHTCLFERIHSDQCWFSLTMRENPAIWWNPSGLWSVRPTPSVHPRFHDEGKFEAWTSHPPRIHIPARGHLSPDHRGTAVKLRGESISLKPAHPNPQNIQQGMEPAKCFPLF